MLDAVKNAFVVVAEAAEDHEAVKSKGTDWEKDVRIKLTKIRSVCRVIRVRLSESKTLEKRRELLTKLTS